MCVVFFFPASKNCLFFCEFLQPQTCFFTCPLFAMAALCASYLEDVAEAELRASEDVGMEANMEEPKEEPKIPEIPKEESPTLPAKPKKLKPGQLPKLLNPGAHNSPLKKRGADKQPRAARGSMQTFAGRRPPADADKLEAYNRMRQDYEALQGEAKQSGKKISLNQSKYYDYMKQEMKKQGGSSKDKFRAAAKGYRSKVGLDK